MEEFSSKRTVNGLVGPRRGLRDTTDKKDKNVQYCNRLGCNGRLNCTKSTRIGNMEKTRPLRPAFGSSNGKEVVASSSSARRPCKESRKSFYNVENKLPREEPKVIKQTEPKVVSKEAGSSSGTTMSGRPRKPFCHNFGSGSGSASSNQKSPMDSSVSVSSKAVSIGTRGGSSSSSGEGYGLRNLKCSSLSEGHPYSSLSESRISRRDVIKRRNLEGEGSSSSSKGKKMGGAPPNLSGISISDSRSRRNTDVGEGKRAVSVRTRRSMNVNTRLSGDSVQESLQTRPSGLSQKLPWPETRTLDMPSSSGQFFTDSSSSDYSLPGNEGDDDDDVSINGFVNRDVLQGYNMDGVAQVLLALERIEQDEEMTYERLLALETNLFFSGLNLYDQHRDMRLDIDDMSYEELLALEEKIGSVCTALPEEALSKCLTRSIYEGIPCKTETVEADSKCSVCQEEYMIGDEIGKLGCEHGYHMECIKQWFKMKNWCPICKTSAAGPPES